MNEAQNTTISVARNTVITLTGDTINANTLRQLIPDLLLALGLAATL